MDILLEYYNYLESQVINIKEMTFIEFHDDFYAQEMLATTEYVSYLQDVT